MLWQEIPDETFEKMIRWRRRLHQIPELSYHEVETATAVCEILSEELGLPAEYRGEGTEAVGRFEKYHDLPTIALRAELDALPLAEETGLPYASQNPGVMHACGHDVHMASLLGAAELIKKNHPPGNVLFVFQPGEERGGGAKVVLKSRLLEGVRSIFGFHVTNHYSLSKIMTGEGAITAQSDSFSIHVTGKSGHGAKPHESLDAIMVLNFLLNAIEGYVSRQLNPLHPTVITVGKIAGGTAKNVIAGEASLEGTIRTTNEDARYVVHEGLRRMVSAAAGLYGAHVKLDIEPGYPSVRNRGDESILAQQAAIATVGEIDVVPMEQPSMGSDDFGFYTDVMPGAYVRLGARSDRADYLPLHSSRFDVDEEVLKVGAAYFYNIAHKALSTYANSI